MKKIEKFLIENGLGTRMYSPDSKTEILKKKFIEYFGITLEGTYFCQQVVEKRVGEWYKTLVQYFFNATKDGGILLFSDEDIGKAEELLYFNNNEEAIEKMLEYLEQYVHNYEFVLTDDMDVSKIPIRCVDADVAKFIIAKKPYYIKNIPEDILTHEFLLEVVEKYPSIVKYLQLSVKYFEYVLIAISKKPSLLEHIPEKYRIYEVCLEAYRRDKKLIKFVPYDLVEKVKINC